MMEKAFPSTMFVCLTLILFLIHVAMAYGQNDQLLFSAEPNMIEVGLAKLVLNCSLEGSKNDRIVSMTITKQEGPDSSGDKEEIATITSFGDQISQTPDLDADVLGNLSQKTSGFLSLEWKSPSKDVQGFYFCSVELYSESFGILDLEKKVNIIYDTPDLSDVLRRLYDLEANMTSSNEENMRIHANITEALDDISRIQSSMMAEFKDMISAVKDISRTQTTMKAGIGAIIDFTRFTATDQFLISKPYDGRLYYLSLFKYKNIDISETICKALGGYLVETDSKAEYDFVVAFIKTYPDASRNTKVKFGGTDEAKEGVWLNRHSGTPVGYYNWGPGQPNNYAGKEHCAEYFYSRGNMNDMLCYYPDPHSRFLCEVPIVN